MNMADLLKGDHGQIEGSTRAVLDHDQAPGRRLLGDDLPLSAYAF
jgi:hypothetical protein